MNNEQIKRKIDETLNSIENINRAVPDDRMFYKIENRLKNINNNKEREFSYIGKFALAFAILIILDIFTFFGYKKIHNFDNLSTTQIVQDNYESKKEFSEEYFFDTNEYNNY